MNKQPKGK